MAVNFLLLCRSGPCASLTSLDMLANGDEEEDGPDLDRLALTPRGSQITTQRHICQGVNPYYSVCYN